MMKRVCVAAGALCVAAVFMPASAQAVYRCARGAYSQSPCAKRTLDTSEAPVQQRGAAKDWDVRRVEQNRIVAQSMRRLPDESDTEFAVRRKRARMLATDRDECARLDSRIPFEMERAKSVSFENAEAGKVGLARSRARYMALGC